MDPNTDVHEIEMGEDGSMPKIPDNQFSRYKTRALSYLQAVADERLIDCFDEETKEPVNLNMFML